MNTKSLCKDHLHEATVQSQLQGHDYLLPWYIRFQPKSAVSSPIYRFLPKLYHISRHVDFFPGFFPLHKPANFGRYTRLLRGSEMPQFHGIRVFMQKLNHIDQFPSTCSCGVYKEPPHLPRKFDIVHVMTLPGIPLCFRHTVSKRVCVIKNWTVGRWSSRNMYTAMEI